MTSAAMARMPGIGIIEAVDALGEPHPEGDQQDGGGLFLQGRPGPHFFVEPGQLEAAVGPVDEVQNDHGQRNGNQAGRCGELDPVEKGEFDAGELFQKRGRNHVAAAADQGDHAAGRGGKGHRQHHEFGRVGVRLDPRRPHQGQHGGDADGRGGRVVKQARGIAESHGQQKGEPDDAVAGFARDGLAETLGQPGLFQGDGEDQAAHDENHHRVHVGRPGPLDIGHAGQDHQHADADGGYLQGNRLEDEQKEQKGQGGQKPLGRGRQAVDVDHPGIGQPQADGLFLEPFGRCLGLPRVESP